MFDVWLFVKARARCKHQLKQHQDQIGELFDSKRELGTRARTFSDHADKLKMFISERLLEYIEYDEKFLHFKNIASEVRHNGVISYDKAQTALKQAQLLCEDGQQQQYREAADGLLYLWDLLDLSTTDNITLHVANQIYDCEEHYFQAQLNQQGSGPSPFEPTFMMSHALRRALLPITENPDELGLNQQWPKRGTYRDKKFQIQLQTDSEMLGNENHMVLLIENLLNNALFYSQQKAYRNRYSIGVTIDLSQRDGEVVLKVFNRGPRINDDEMDKIYQLGFSSRRIREHHGKGLGLFFVNEITKGFEGSIVFNNIENHDDNISLSVKLTNGEIYQHRLVIVDTDGRPMCRDAESESQVDKRHEWSYTAPIASVEVSTQTAKNPQLISGLMVAEDSNHVDVTDPLRSHWVVDVKNRKRSSKLLFSPLDIRGVEFVVRVPTAKSRLDNQD